MNFKTFLLVAVFILVSNEAQAKSLPNFKANSLRSVNGGTNCAACTIIVALAEQLSIVYNQTVEQSLDQICNFLPPNSIFKVTCQQAVEEFGPLIINGYRVFF
jgi:hypothetical protein